MPKYLTFTFPEPPSANRYWRMGGGHIHKSKEAKTYQANLADTVRMAMGRLPLFPKPIPVILTIAWYRSRKSGDLDNRLKIIGDALRGAAYTDDSQVVVIHATRHDHRTRKGEVDITIAEATP